jgi:hypothetical protein
VVNDAGRTLLLLGCIRVHEQHGRTTCVASHHVAHREGIRSMTGAQKKDQIDVPGPAGPMAGAEACIVVTTTRQYCSGWLGQKKWRSTHSTASIASGGNSLGPHPAVVLPPSPRFTPSCCLRHLASRRSGEREKLDRSPAAWRDGGLQPGYPARRCSPARRPPDQERMVTFRSGENERRERERMEEREIENG